MKVVHVVGGKLTGGAARGAYWLHKSLVDAGVSSKLLINDSDTNNDSTIFSLKMFPYDKLSSIRLRGESCFVKLKYPKKKNQIFSVSLVPTFLYKNKHIQEADIIHLHWVNDGCFSLFELSKFNKPIIWTIRDMWPITGGCHYSLDCNKYKTGCGQCPLLNSGSDKDITSSFLKLKMDLYEKNNVIPVGISNWTGEVIRSSIAFEKVKERVRVIPNTVDESQFHVLSKNESRLKHGLADKKTILFGAQNPKDFYKGFEKLKAVLQNLQGDYQIISFGESVSEHLAPLKVKNFGFIRDSHVLNEIYSCADVFIMTSLSETFGKTLAEAMLCGVPCVAFDYSGPTDIIDHNVNGYLARPYDINDFEYGIEYVLNNKEYSLMAKKAREKIINSFSLEKGAKRYHALYEKVLNAKGK